MKKYITWLGAAVLLIFVVASAGMMVRTAQRVAANDIPIQLAEDVAAQLNSGTSPAAIAGNHVDFEHSLAGFVVVYDKSGKPIAGTGYLNGNLPVAPYGILTAASGKEYHTVTWQPQADTRVAAATVAAKNYYVLGGQSLKEVERQENVTYELTAVALVTGLLIPSATYFLVRKL
jgi:hypothetical protein